MSSIGAFTGKIKWFDASKGYGFASRDGHDKDVFVHAHALRKSGLDAAAIQEEDEIRFDCEETDRGFKATNISRI